MCKIQKWCAKFRVLLWFSVVLWTWLVEAAKEVPVSQITGVLGTTVNLPCDISVAENFRQEEDSLVLILWYRENLGTPIYSCETYTADGSAVISDNFSRISIISKVASYTTACTDGSQSDSINASIQTNVYVPSYITPLIEQCILFDLKALLTSSMQLTQAQEAVIRCYYSYCKNIINMAKLVSTLQSNPNGGGSMPMPSTPQTPTMPGAPQTSTIPGVDPNMPGSSPVPDPSASLSANIGPSGVAASVSS